MTILKTAIRAHLLGSNYDTAILPLLEERKRLLPYIMIINNGAIQASDIDRIVNDSTTKVFVGVRPSFDYTKDALKDQQEWLAKIRTYPKTKTPEGEDAHLGPDGVFYYDDTLQLYPQLTQSQINAENLNYKMVFLQNVGDFVTTTDSSVTNEISFTIGLYRNRLGQKANLVKNLTISKKFKQVTTEQVAIFKRAIGVFGSSKFPTMFPPLKSDPINSFRPNLKAFNFFVSVINHYNKYQTTGLLFTNPNDRDVQTAILSGNVLKALTSQSRFLVPNGQTLVSYNDTLAGKSNIAPDLAFYIWVCTMGYLKEGDIIVSSLQKYFVVNETYKEIVERVRAMGTNQTVDGFFTAPPFVFNIMGSSWNVTSMPTGKMVLKVINDCLLEAQELYKVVLPSGVSQ